MAATVTSNESVPELGQQQLFEVPPATDLRVVVASFELPPQDKAFAAHERARVTVEVEWDRKASQAPLGADGILYQQTLNPAGTPLKVERL